MEREKVGVMDLGHLKTAGLVQIREWRNLKDGGQRQIQKRPLEVQ